MSQKVLGAFYTPDLYVHTATEYIRKAIANVKTKDYVIIDRCAGSGNLEKFLTEEELSHCILNTYAAKEWLALKQRYDGKIRQLIPLKYDINGTLLKGGNALEESFLDNFKEIFKKRDLGELTIIMLENPPYADTGGGNTTNKGKGVTTSWVSSQMNTGISKRDLMNQFFWSAWEYFKPESYIVFGPCKYFKTQNYADSLNLIEGKICNRALFNASESGITLMYWKPNGNYVESWNLDGDIIKRCKKTHLDLRVISNLPDTFAYMSCDSFGITYQHARIADEKFRGGSAGVYLAEDNLLINLPLLVAGLFELKTFKEIDILMKSSDGGTIYQKDSDFLNDCLIYTLLTNKNKCSKTCKLYPYGFSLFKPEPKHKKLLELWGEIYDQEIIYGLNNVIEECLEPFKVKDKKGNYYQPDTNKAKLDSNVKNLKIELKDFYIKEIRPKMLKYELVK